MALSAFKTLDTLVKKGVVGIPTVVWGSKQYLGFAVTGIRYELRKYSAYATGSRTLPRPDFPPKVRYENQAEVRGGRSQQSAELDGGGCGDGRPFSVSGVAT